MICFQKEVEFLGVIAGTYGIKIYLIKGKAASNWPKSRNLTDLRSSLGLVKFFWRFSKKVSSIYKPLQDLTGKDMGLKYWWTEIGQSFRKLKQHLTAAPVLIDTDWSKVFAGNIDTSFVTSRATLTQNFNEGHKRIIAYALPKLSPAEQNQTANNRELLGLINSFQQFKCYQERVSYTVFMDDQVVSHLFSDPEISCREDHWIEALVCLIISEISLKPGEINMLGDWLFRIQSVQ